MVYGGIFAAKFCPLQFPAQNQWFNCLYKWERAFLLPEDTGEGTSTQLAKTDEVFDIHKYVGQELEYSKNPYYESSSQSNDLVPL